MNFFFFLIFQVHAPLKATEFWLLLSYTACIIFHKILDSKFFLNHFLLLMYAMRIFCDPEMSQNEVK